LKDGRTVDVHVEHAIGSLQRPMTDAMLERKFHDLADPILGAERSHQIIQACWTLGKAPHLKNLLALLKP
jgi:2-methylcitrate dehydratase PrpD